jgi:hypothetical protein
MMMLKLWGVCHTQSCDPSHGLEVKWGMSNTVISKLWGVCRIQLCDLLHGLEITWGLKMSKLLNLIAYSLACLLTCTNWVLSWICEHLVKHVSLFLVLMILPLSLFRVENHVCLSRGVQVAGAAWRAAMRIMVGVGDLVQRTSDGQAQAGYSVAGWLRGRVTLCAVCTMHKEMRSAGFLDWPQNQGRWFVSGLASKPHGRVSRFGR